MENNSNQKKITTESSAANQAFHDSVDSVAGRDAIDNSEHVAQTSLGEGAVNVNRAENVNVVQLNRLLTSLAESTLQANFFAATGIRCRKEVRILLETLMDEHGFHFHELARAWNTSTISFDAKKRQLRNNSRAFDLTFGWGGIAFSTLIFVALIIPVLGADSAHQSPYVNAIAIGLIVGLLGAIALFIHVLLHPQQVARRIERALDSQQA